MQGCKSYLLIIFFYDFRYVRCNFSMCFFGCKELGWDWFFANDVGTPLGVKSKFVLHRNSQWGLLDPIDV